MYCKNIAKLLNVLQKLLNVLQKYCKEQRDLVALDSEWIPSVAVVLGASGEGS